MGVVATFDIGTNSVLCLIAEAREEGIAARDDRCIVTRLGEGVDASGVLQPRAVERTLAALRELSAVARAAGVARRAAVGTSALRDASNSKAVIGAGEDILGCPIEVISGAREAALTFDGACAGLELAGARTIVDVGGGSTELVRGTASPEETRSIDIGSVRLTERFLRGDPPSPSEIGELRRYAVSAIADAASILSPVLVGVAGTITTLAMLDAGLTSYSRSSVHGRRLARSAVDVLVARLAESSVAERARLPGMPEGRALPILAGALIVAAVLEVADASSLIVSDGGVRYGLAAELLRL